MFAVERQGMVGWAPQPVPYQQHTRTYADAGPGPSRYDGTAGVHATLTPFTYGQVQLSASGATMGMAPNSALVQPGAMTMPPSGGPPAHPQMMRSVASPPSRHLLHVDLPGNGLPPHYPVGMGLGWLGDGGGGGGGGGVDGGGGGGGGGVRGGNLLPGAPSHPPSSLPCPAGGVSGFPHHLSLQPPPRGRPPAYSVEYSGPGESPMPGVRGYAQPGSPLGFGPSGMPTMSGYVDRGGMSDAPNSPQVCPPTTHAPTPTLQRPPT